MDLSTIDFILIFVYFAVLLMIGYFTSRKQNEEDYLIAERKLGSWSTMATMNASKSGSILMTFVALTYLWGFAAVWYFVGVIAGVFLFIPFALKLKDNSQNRFYTLANYFKYNYGKKSAVFASLISVVLMFGLGIINLIAGTKIFVFFTGWSFWLCAILMAIVILTYLLLGGFRAVAKTDVLQYIAMIFILIMLAFILFDGALIPASDWDVFSTDLITVIGFFIVGVMFPFASPDLWQRIYSSKGKKELRNGMLLSVVIYAFMATLLALVALTVKAQFPLIDPDIALLHGFGNLLPMGLIGLSSVLLFAAIMSSLDTYIFTGSSAIIQDFFDWDKKKTVKNIKKVIFLFAVVGTAISIIIQDLILGTYIFVAFYAVLAMPVIYTWINKKIKQRTLLLSFIFGILGTLAFLIISLSKGEITPTVVMAAIGSSILGLIIGSVISLYQKKKQ
jgi:Na+/proline symporter